MWPSLSNEQAEEGRVYVYYGSPSGPKDTADWVVESNEFHSRFGNSVGTAGDVNGDGFDDVIIGAPVSDEVQDNEGRVFVYYGSEAGLSLTPDWTAESDQWNARFGLSAHSAGDVNGDGFDDVIVGARNYSHGQEDEGMVFVYHGSATGL
ncbi:MAG: integrin alpha, partial [Anaerolineae bacterium]